MTELFEYDVFLSYSSKDRPAVRELAERLRRDGLRVWFDEWEIRPGDLIPLKIEHGLERSQTLVQALSASAFESEWVKLERHTVLFRDPTNAQRRFIPLLLDNSKIGDALKHFAYIDWQDRSEEQYARLLEACSPISEVEPASLPLDKSKRHWLTLKPAALVLIFVFGIGALVIYFPKGERKAANIAVNTEPSPLAEEAGGGVSGLVPPRPHSNQKQPGSRLLATQPMTEPPSPKPARKRTTDPSSITAETSLFPSEAPKRQAASEPTPAAPSTPEPTPVEEERPAPPADAGLDQFKAMEGLVISIESLSKKAVEDCEAEGKEDEICSRLEDFSKAATALRREFRKATGTGIRGIFHKVRGGADTKALEIKVDDLTQKRESIDGLIASNPPGQTTQSHWREIQDNLIKLKSYF